MEYSATRTSYVIYAAHTKTWVTDFTGRGSITSPTVWSSNNLNDAYSFPFIEEAREVADELNSDGDYRVMKVETTMRVLDSTISS